MVSIISVTAFLLCAHQQYLHVQSQKHTIADVALQQLEQLQNNISADNCTVPSAETLKQWLFEARKPAEVQKSLIQEWLEVFRSFFSGVSKGNNFATLIALAFLQTDPQDHEHGPSAMLMLTVASAAVFSAVLSLRALARGLGKDNTAKKEPVVVEKTAAEATKTKAAGESGESTEKSPPASLRRTLSLHNVYRFFVPNDINSSPTTPREQHTIQGLM
jgi:hypothetical protein